MISTGLPHLIIPFVDRAVMMDVDHERRAYVAELADAYDCDSAALVAAGVVPVAHANDGGGSIRYYELAQGVPNHAHATPRRPRRRRTPSP